MRTRLAQPADAAGQIAHEPDLNVVLAVLGKRVLDRRATACTDRQPRHLFFLRKVGRKANDVVLHRGLRSSYNKAADFLRGGNVTPQERGRQVANDDIIETLTT